MSSSSSKFTDFVKVSRISYLHSFNQYFPMVSLKWINGGGSVDDKRTVTVNIGISMVVKTSKER